MKEIQYRKSVSFWRFLIAFGVVIFSIILITEGAGPEEYLFRRIMNFAGGIVGIWFFGRMMILSIIVLFKNPTLFSYDAQKINVDGIELKRTDILKVEQCTVPSGILGTKVDAFTLITKDKLRVEIPTYYVLTKQENDKIFKALKEYISNHKSALLQ